MSMIIPIGPAGGGAGGGGNYILIFADLPQYIAGKYIVVELSGTEIYAATVPNDVQSVTVSITEAGTYTVKVYASSSSSSPSETHTVNVTTLTVNYGVKVGDTLYFNESGGTTYKWYEVSDSALNTFSIPNQTFTRSGDSAEWADETTLGTFIASGDGLIKFHITGELSNYTRSGGSGTWYIRVAVCIKQNNTRIQTLNAYSSGTDVTIDNYVGVRVEKNKTYTISYSVYVGSASSSASSVSISIKTTDAKAQICGDLKTFTTQSTKGILSRAIKSVQYGITNSSAGEIYFSPVNPEKALVFSVISSSQYENFRICNPDSPGSVFLSTNIGISGSTTNWTVIEYY